MKQTTEYWVEASLGSEGMGKKLAQALLTIQTVHNHTVDYLNSHFINHNGEIPSFQEYRTELNRYIKENKLWRFTQRYSMEKAAEQTFPYFTSASKFDERERFVPVPYDSYNSLQIKARKVWRKYLADGGGMTTIYGTLFLENDWKGVLRQQAGKIPLDLFPFLWHSITLKIEGDGKYFLKFNFHSPSSKRGENAKEELEEAFADME